MKSAMALVAVMFLVVVSVAYAGNFNRDFEVSWGGTHAQSMENGKHMQLSLDSYSGAAFQSKKDYLYGKFDVRMKLVGGNSAGTVTTFYLSSTGTDHDEIDFEFLGNLSGDPYTVHTNVYAQGKGEREEQFHLWFDPTSHFHTYSILWSPEHIVWMVDDSPIRVYTNGEKVGIPYPKQQRMKVYGSLWNADEWATRGGLVKTDWSKAPFVASYRVFRLVPCYSPRAAPHAPCSVSTPDKWWNQLQHNNNNNHASHGGSMAGNSGVNGALQKLRWVQKNYRIYGYCNDAKRFSQGLPKDCSLRL